MRLTYSVVAAAAALAAAVSTVADVAVGDSLQKVLQTLGPPRGYLRTEDYTVLYYERGRVELLNGCVATAHLMTEEQARALRERREQEEKARREAEARRRSKLIVEGEQALQLLLSDAEFLAAPASVQVAVWREFAARYPYTPLPEHYLRALERLEKELAAQEQERRLAELEARVAEAEREAAAAREEARSTPCYVYYPVPWYGPCVREAPSPPHHGRRPGIRVRYAGRLIHAEYNVPLERARETPCHAPRPCPGVYTEGRVLTHANGTPFVAFSLARRTR